MARKKLPVYDWDYRCADYPGRGKDLRHPHDMSIMTYTGHHVLQTLIRCYFSPTFTTGQRYIYTGSHDGRLYIYDLVSGVLVARLGFHREVVRDLSWHPTAPMLASVSWDGQVARWEHLRGNEPPFTPAAATKGRTHRGNRGGDRGAPSRGLSFYLMHTSDFFY
eukprot:SM000114S24123  [mRNA]  locus=s114:173673:174707:+ [translate_table: standard]